MPRDLIFDAERHLSHEEGVHLRYELDLRAGRDDSDQHPINIEDIDLCELEHSISTSNTLVQSKLEEYSLDKLKIVVASIGKVFPGKRASRQKAASIISSYVKDSHQKMDEAGDSCPHYQPQLTITE